MEHQENTQSKKCTPVIILQASKSIRRKKPGKLKLFCMIFGVNQKSVNFTRNVRNSLFMSWTLQRKIRNVVQTECTFQCPEVLFLSIYPATQA